MEVSEARKKSAATRLAVRRWEKQGKSEEEIEQLLKDRRNKQRKRNRKAKKKTASQMPKSESRGRAKSDEKRKSRSSNPKTRTLKFGSKKVTGATMARGRYGSFKEAQAAASKKKDTHFARPFKDEKQDGVYRVYQKEK